MHQFHRSEQGLPKGPLPLPLIDQIVDSMAGCDLLCFLDAFLGYHQIKMVVEDEEKTAFITSEGVYCYVCMHFGLKNAGATFQRAMRECLGCQMGRNVEAYMDNIVVKTRSQDTLIEDLRETFDSLRKVHLKLNPEKCTFGVPSGKLLGFLVSHRGIEANPDKIKAIEEMQPPRKVKDVQRLNGCITALGCFISRLGERALPFFQLLKKKGPIGWTPEADEALQKLKQYLSSPLILVAPRFKEPLLLYVAATTQVVSAVLVAEREKRLLDVACPSLEMASQGPGTAELGPGTEGCPAQPTERGLFPGDGEQQLAAKPSSTTEKRQSLVQHRFTSSPLCCAMPGSGTRRSRSCCWAFSLPLGSCVTTSRSAASLWSPCSCWNGCSAIAMP